MIRIRSNKMVDDRPLVTIAIPTYNRADAFLEQAIESAVSQTYTNLEIIVADNCSSDHTETVVQKFCDHRIKYVRHKQNIGANNNFNFCVEKANGVYFLLLHDDDLIDEDFIEICMRTANYRTDVGLIRTGMRKIDSHRNVLLERYNLVGGLSITDFFLGWFLDRTTMYLCSTLFKTQNLKEIGGFNSKHNLFQDVTAEIILAAKFGRVDVKDIKASYRDHPMINTYSADVGAWCEDSIDLLDLICELAHQNKELVRRTGLKFFASRNYKLARKIESPIQRYLAYLKIFKTFDYEIDYFKRRLYLRIMSILGRSKKNG